MTPLRGTLYALVVLAACVAGCASHRAPDQGVAPVEVPKADADQVHALESALAAAMEAYHKAWASREPTSSADGAEICDHVRAICRISARICAISKRYPQHPEVAASCGRSIARCDDARGRAASLCPAPKNRP